MTARPLILIAEDHPLFRDAVVRGLSRRLPGHRVAEAGSLDEVRAMLRVETPVLLLLDLAIPGATGLSGLVTLLGEAPTLPIAVLSAQQDPTIVARSLALGARGYLPKSLDLSAMICAMKTMLGGGRWVPAELETRPPEDLALRFATLSPQQMRVLTAIGDGKLNKQIAVDLDISEQRVKEHVSQIFRKLAVMTRTQAALMAKGFLEGRTNGA